MTFEQAYSLLEMDRLNKLKTPKHIKDIPKERLISRHGLISLITNSILGKKNSTLIEATMGYYKCNFERLEPIFRNKTQKERWRLIFKEVIETLPSVKSISGEGSALKPFVLDCDYGNGIFFDAEDFFPTGWPAYLEPNQCFYTAEIVAEGFKNEFKSSVISGIAWSGEPFVHAVAKIVNKNGKKFVFDTNYHLVMSYELYKSIFLFKVLNEVEIEEFEKNNKYLTAFQNELKKQGKKLDYGAIDLAFDDIVARGKKLIEEDGFGV